MEEKVVAEAEERRRAAEAEACRIAEERGEVAAAVRRQAVLDMEAKWKAEAEEAGMEQGSGSLLKQKERAEGEPAMCDCCVTWGMSAR